MDCLQGNAIRAAKISVIQQEPQEHAGMVEEPSQPLCQGGLVDAEGRDLEMGLGDQRRVDWRNSLDRLASLPLLREHITW